MKFKVILFGFLAFLLFVGNVSAQTSTPSPTRSPGVNGRLRSCEARIDAVKNRMNALVRLADNMKRVFDRASDRVQNFYVNVILPSGKTLSNYDALTSDIAAKKAKVDTDLASAQAKIDAFNCESGDARTLLKDFRTNMQTVKSDLKAYRISVKNLIVAIRPLAPKPTEEPEGTEEPEDTNEPNDDGDESPEPSGTPDED